MDQTKKPKRQLSPQSLANLKPVKKGEIRNPLGCAAGDPIKRAMRNFTKNNLADIIEIAVTGDIMQLQQIANSQTEPAIKVGVARALANAIQMGDWGTIQSVIAWIVGTVPKEIKVSSDENTPLKIEFVKAERKDDSTT